MLIYCYFFFDSIFFQGRTRAALLDGLYMELDKMNSEYFGVSFLQPSKHEGNKFLNTVKRALSGKNRTPALDARDNRKSNGITVSLPTVGEDERTPTVVNNAFILLYHCFSSTVFNHFS